MEQKKPYVKPEIKFFPRWLSPVHRNHAGSEF